MPRRLLLRLLEGLSVWFVMTIPSPNSGSKRSNPTSLDHTSKLHKNTSKKKKKKTRETQQRGSEQEVRNRHHHCRSSYLFLAPFIQPLYTSHHVNTITSSLPLTRPPLSFDPAPLHLKNNEKKKRGFEMAVLCVGFGFVWGFVE